MKSIVRSLAVEMALQQRATGRRIAQLREQSRMTQEVAADKAGVTLRAYQKWEAGGGIQYANLQKLAEVFRVPVERITGEEHAPDPFKTSGQLDRIEADLQAARTERHDLVAMLEQRIEQLERAVEHQTANLARQSKLLERIEERERRIFKVLEDAEVIERAADGAAAALAKGPPGGPELLGRKAPARQPTPKRRRAKDAQRQDQRRDTA